MENQYKYLNDTTTPEYDKHFWNYLRGDDSSYPHIEMGMCINSSGHYLPWAGNKIFREQLKKHSAFRRLATVIRLNDHSSNVYTKVTEDLAMWVPRGGEIPVYGELDNFDFKNIDSEKVAVMFRLDSGFVEDKAFDIEKHMATTFARSFGKTEDYGFINGNGNGMPIGIAADDGGADIGVTASGDISFDDIIKLYFTVQPDFRENGVWLMTDETALKLKLMKNQDGIALWNHNSDTLLGKPVCICNSMPEHKPVAFGDLTYYWVYESFPLSVRKLVEKFSLYDQIAYLGVEYVGGRLTRTDAVKVISVQK